VKVAQNNGDFTTKEFRAVMKYLFLKGNPAKEMYGMSVTLGDKRPSYCAVKNWVSEKVKLSRNRPWRPIGM
jgi:hypothetical protein